jgi:hypothetical protein
MVKKWAIGSNQYIKKLAASDPSWRQEIPLQIRVSEQHALTGITWAALDLDAIQPSTVERARFRFRTELPELIWNAAALEGNNFTLPEVRTLLDGVTVGGHRTDEAEQILALSDAYSWLDEQVGDGTFLLDKQVSDSLHSKVAVHEAIESGHFRGEGRVTGGGSVHLSNGGYIDAVDGGPNGETLIALHQDLLAYLETFDDPRERSLAYFAAATRRQFYFDGNKRTSRLMMTGELIAHGFEAVGVPYSRKLEFNVALDQLFETDDATQLMQFLVTCAAR